jgi:hypothetical protein
MIKSISPFILGLLLLMAFQCQEEVDHIRDGLFLLGFYTTWEYDSETINGVSDLSVKCCRYFEFAPDDNLDDMVGNYFYWADTTVNQQGTFTVDTLNREIHFDRLDRSQIIYQYAMNDSFNYLTFTYTEDSLNYVQGWRRLY